ncbi:phage replication-related protein YjqB (UPF0714/DUF867 family) [Nonomuraea thailandensis]|uniref:Phage replication-related protein YjqB (UPF0714/DUF867 family) n=1 Tax=Nonomuraea thailandensis TaxID=1188745 RepID=A0A9X2GQ76_9ACTN|nr:poly-gamma-glutamate hydrolase family protein [Nonomuraea thailandensis]MCP2363231.1 phage replication-related protein YjqB (UPF0714/DUF867 family) [Nonomuraea thailandensis]
MRETVAAGLLLLLPLTTPHPAHATVADVYPDYPTLAKTEVEGQDYLRLQRVPKGAAVAHIAVHGGAIEPPTTQLADHAAGRTYAFYSFVGIKPDGNSRLHITSTNFDEPRALKLVGAVDYTVSWHAAAGSTVTTYVGGRDTKLAAEVAASLREAGFAVAETVPDRINGTSPRNLG